MRERSGELAAGWIEAWKRFDMEWLRTRLAPEFVHISPFGRWPLAGSGPSTESLDVSPEAQK